MYLRDSGLGESRPPLAWIAAVAVGLCLAAGVGLLVTERHGPPSSGPAAPVRRFADSVTGGAGAFLAAPVRWLSEAGDTVGGYFLAGHQNTALKGQVAAGLAWRDRVAALQLENTRLRALLGVRTDPPMPMVFAHTVLDARGPFSNARLADAGAAQGVTEGNPVLSDHGLIGRVTGVAAGVSRVMLLTDVASRTPVLIARTNGRAILSGDGGPNPSLTYLRTHDAPRPGDRVLTSGDGGVLPRGLPVGVVAAGAGGEWRVALDADAEPIDDVRILLFKDFSQLTPAVALEPRTLPSTATGAPLPPLPEAPAPSAAARPAP